MLLHVLAGHSDRIDVLAEGPPVQAEAQLGADVLLEQACLEHMITSFILTTAALSCRLMACPRVV